MQNASPDFNYEYKSATLEPTQIEAAIVLDGDKQVCEDGKVELEVDFGVGEAGLSCKARSHPTELRGRGSARRSFRPIRSKRQ